MQHLRDSHAPCNLGLDGPGIQLPHQPMLTNILQVHYFVAFWYLFVIYLLACGQFHLYREISEILKTMVPFSTQAEKQTLRFTLTQTH